MRLWLTGKDFNQCLSQARESWLLPLCPSSQNSDLSTPPIFKSALSKDQGSLFIQPMKATHKHKNLLHQLERCRR